MFTDDASAEYPNPSKEVPLRFPIHQPAETVLLSLRPATVQLPDVVVGLIQNAYVVAVVPRFCNAVGVPPSMYCDEAATKDAPPSIWPVAAVGVLCVVKLTALLVESFVVNVVPLGQCCTILKFVSHVPLTLPSCVVCATLP